MIYDLYFSNGKCFIFNQSDLLDAMKSQLSSSCFYNVTLEDAPVFYTVFGNDYVSHPYKKELSYESYVTSVETGRENAFPKI